MANKFSEELSHFSIFSSFSTILQNEDSALEFGEVFGLIPSKYSTPPDHCGVPMKVENDRNVKLGWTWRCARGATGKKCKGRKVCRARVNPNTGSIFDCNLAVSEVLALIFCFVVQLAVNFSHNQMQKFRLSKGDSTTLSKETVVHYFQKFRSLMEIINSHDPVLLGGEGKTVELDETFLTKRKYHRGRMTAQIKTVIFGLHCREDKVTLFFPVPTKSKVDLWPLISKYVHPDTSVVCTDGGKQYNKVKELFSCGTEHLVTNHSIGEFVSSSDSRNTINSLENQNKLVKKAIKSRRSGRDIELYIHNFVYRQRRFQNMKDDEGAQILAYLEDLVKVFPPYTNGVLPPPLMMNETPRLPPRSERVEKPTPSTYFESRCPKI